MSAAFGNDITFLAICNNTSIFIYFAYKNWPGHKYALLFPAWFTVIVIEVNMALLEV